MEIFLLVIGLIIMICYFKVANSLEIKNFSLGFLSLLVLTFVSYVLILMVLIVNSQNVELKRKFEKLNRCPELEKEDVYRMEYLKGTSFVQTLKKYDSPNSSCF